MIRGCMDPPFLQNGAMSLIPRSPPPLHYAEEAGPGRARGRKTKVIWRPKGFSGDLGEPVQRGRKRQSKPLSCCVTLPRSGPIFSIWNRTRVSWAKQNKGRCKDVELWPALSQRLLWLRASGLPSVGLSFPQSAMGDGEHTALELPLASASPGVAGLVCPGILPSPSISCVSLSLPSPSHRALPGAAGDELTGGLKAWACFISSLGSGHQGRRAGQRSPADWSRPERPDAAKSARELGNMWCPPALLPLP